jgi:hypothetical protein
LGMGKVEWGIGKIRMRKSECGIGPPASPSCRLYEPEAVGAIDAYAPEGRRKAEFDCVTCSVFRVACHNWN